MRDRASKSIETPDDDHIKTTGVGIIHHPVEFWSRILLPRYPIVYIAVKNLPTPPLAVLGEFSGLHGWVLTVTDCGNSGIDRRKHLPRSGFGFFHNLQSH